MSELTFSSLLKKSKEITQQFDALKKLKNLGENSILEDREQSTFWIVSKEGERIRAICGHRNNKGICFRPAGWGTDHVGFSKCKDHMRGSLYNSLLSAQHNYPTRLVELLEFTNDLEDRSLNSLDPEIKMLTALYQFVLTRPRDSEDMDVEEIDTIREIIKDLVKTKALRNKIQREMRLDASSVKEFVHQIFSVISYAVNPAVAKKIMEDINNKVLVPFMSKDRIIGKDMNFETKAAETIKKYGNTLKNIEKVKESKDEEKGEEE